MVAPTAADGKASDAQLFLSATDKRFMNTTTLPHEEFSLYAPALVLCRATIELARTEIRIINSRLRHHSVRLLEQIASCSRASTPKSRAQLVQYARMRISKLAAVVDAAWCERAVTDEKRTFIREAVQRLESELDVTLESDAKADAIKTQQQTVGERKQRRRARPSPTALTPDDLSDLDCLVQRDSTQASHSAWPGAPSADPPT